MHIGAPCCGMNAAVRSFVRNMIYRGDVVLGIHGGIDGLIQGEVSPLEWPQVSGWVAQGGAFLGTRRTLPNDNNQMEKVVNRFEEFNIQALLIVGGFEAYHSALQMAEARPTHSALRIPICVIPATIRLV